MPRASNPLENRSKQLECGQNGPFFFRYARPLMEKLVMKLQSSQHRGVREEAITSIAVIAGVMEQESRVEVS